MTADVNVSLDVKGSSAEENSEVNVTMKSSHCHEDLSNADCNGNSKDDGDTSYVFVDRKEDISVTEDDLLVPNADLTAKDGHGIQKNESLVHNSSFQDDDDDDDDEQKEGTAAVEEPNPTVTLHANLDGVQENQESQNVVSVAVECGEINDGEGDDSESNVQVEIQESHNTCTNVAGIELNESGNEGEKVDEESESNVAADIHKNQDSQMLSAEDVKTNLNSDQDEEPVGLRHEVTEQGHEMASGVQLVQNLEMVSCLEVAEVKAEQAEAGNTPESNECGDEFIPNNAQSGVAETCDVNDLINANENQAEHHDSTEKVETWTVSDVKINKSLPTTNDDDAIGVLSNGYPEAAVQLESEAASGHSDIGKYEGLHSDRAQESVLQIVATAPEPHRTSDISKTLPSHVGGETLPVESCENILVAPVNDTVVKPTLETGDSCGCPMKDVEKSDDVGAEIQVESLDVNNSDGVGTPSVDDTKFEIEAENGCVVNDKKPCFLANNSKEDLETDAVYIGSRGEESTFSSGAINIESKVLEGQAECAIPYPVSGDNPDVDEESSISNSVETKYNLLSSSIDEKTELEVKNSLVAASEDMCHIDDIVSKSEGLNDSVISSEGNLNCFQDDVHVENGGDLTVNDNENACEVMEAVDAVPRDETSTSFPKGSTVDAFDGQNAATEVGKRPFYYMIRIPRYEDENLKEQIKHAQLEVDQKTKSRDVIRDDIRIERANLKECGDNLEVAKSEENVARNLLKAKRKEMDSLQSLINFEDVDGRIRNMERMLQHETLPLKEEKQFIREIKQLKQLREQLSSNKGSQDEVQQTIDNKDQVEESLQVLRKEADSLRDKVFKAEAVTKDARKKYHDEKLKINDLQHKFDAADAIRQKAYEHLQTLRKELNKKNTHFWKYKDNANAAHNLALEGNKEELQHLCITQVEEVMKLWNPNDEFRKDYIRCNMKSTLRRLRTLDGRSLGPDEEPLVIPYFVADRVAKDNVVQSITTVEGGTQGALLDEGKADDKSIAKVVDQKNQAVKTKKPAKPVPSQKGLAAVSVKDEIEVAGQEEHKPTKEEEELARKAEALKKMEVAAMLKEQQRLEEKAKAKEAMERKKRNTEKAKARAELRAQKEAEQKEKEREKKAKKKERKKAVAEDTNNVNEDESAASSENQTEAKEPEMREKPVTAAKQLQKPSPFTKQTKAKTMPLPLRNRSKRKIQTWMWALLTALVILALFLIGNSSFSFHFGLQRFGF